MGLIEAVAHPRGGRGHHTEYHLHLDSGRRKPPYEPQRKGAKTAPFVKGDSGDQKGCQTEPERVSAADGKGDTHARASMNRPGSKNGSVIEPPTRARELVTTNGHEQGENGVPVIRIPRGASARSVSRLTRTAERLGAQLIHESTNGAHHHET
jgi:hypothetical protein